MLKRIFDIIIATIGLVALGPFILLAMAIIWFEDFSNPFYVSPRCLSRSRTFNMIKLRSMVNNAEKLGGTSTSATDRRITRVGHLIRKTKFDEVPQLWSVLIGDMSIVGPRPQVVHGMSLYTEEEYHLFDARPGITDFASLVFSDEGEILKDSPNPDLKYNQLIRPWKSRLGIFYTLHQTVFVDIQIILLTIVSPISRKMALKGVQYVLVKLDADKQLIEVAGRSKPLQPFPPPGALDIETRY
jgi:lipopolysaccharide/colanic/teichoic acid biosynthesis glycosyltransferase